MRLALFTKLAAAVAIAAALGARADIPEKLERQMRSLGVPAASSSLIVMALDSDKPLWALNPDTPRNPASLMKLITTFAALDRLGPGHRWPTEAFVAARPDRDGAIDDLYIKGYGNPFWVAEEFADFVLELEQLGLRKIVGDIVLDTSYYDLPAAHPAEFDGKGYRVYNVQPHPLTMNFNSVRFLLVPHPQTGELRVETRPAFSNLVIDNDIALERKACRTSNIDLNMQIDKMLDGLTKVTFGGRFPSRCSRFALTRSVLSHEEQIVGALSAGLRRHGVEVSGGWRQGEVPEDARLFHKQLSRPLGDLIRSTNKFSNNVMARQIFLSIGAEAFGAPATPDKARLAVNQSLAQNGLTFADLDVDNGAGLSRNARISAGSLMALLQTAWKHRYGSDFFGSLPVPGVDGTLESRFPRGAYVGQAYVKTGTLDHVSGIAGLVQADSGNRYLIVYIINHEDIHKGAGRALQKSLLRTLVTDG